MNSFHQIVFPGFRGKVFENKELKDLVTFRIGGPADFVLLPSDENDVKAVVEACSWQSIPLTIIGSGSNLLVRDKGIHGAVLYLGHSDYGHITEIGREGFFVDLDVSSQVTKAHLLDYAIKNNLAGLEFSAGIPGALGGAVYMNAGTKWGSYSEVITSVKFFHPNRGFYTLKIEELGLKYRGHGEGLFDDGVIVISVQMRLKQENSNVSIRERVDEILTYRGQKQPLELPNCGSVFKNPENSRRGAGRLIEACGLKGKVIGGAQISLKHANFILNLGNASSEDVEGLISFIQQTVYKEFKIRLETEVIVIGEK